MKPFIPTIAIFLALVAGLAAENKPAVVEKADDAAKTSSVVGEEKPKLLLSQHLVEAWHDRSLDKILSEPDAFFWEVFSRLPDEVIVYPTENYYYWKMEISGREIYGNIRLPSGRRERGVLSFGYAEFEEFPSGPNDKEISHAKYFTEGDGLIVKRVGDDEFKWSVSYNKKTVIFNLNKLPQTPPKKFTLPKNEVFVQRTFDESGNQFFLLFNTENNYFIWVLNEEVGMAENFKPISDDATVGERSGFIYWVDKKNGDRKVLTTIRKISVLRNDYYDGPFDQLADNYADETKIREYIEKAIPSIKGRIDKYGYYTDVERPSRVAISNYGNYYTIAEALAYIESAKKAFDPYFYIARGGIPPMGKNWDGKPVTAAPTPATPATPAQTGEAKKPVEPTAKATEDK
jgi:hypothetical protein